MENKDNSRKKSNMVSKPRIVIKPKFNSASKTSFKKAVKIKPNPIYKDFISSFKNLEITIIKLAEKNNIKTRYLDNALIVRVPFRELVRKLYRRKVIDIVYITKVKVLRDLFNCISSGKEANIESELIDEIDDMVAKAKSLLID